MIEIKNVSQAYGKKQVLFDINLKIQDQMITGLIGPNGAGKSILLSVISRLLEPLQGSVTLDGLDVRNIKSKELAKRIAVLRQNNNINLKLTVEELVEFGRFPHSNGRLTKEDKIKVDERSEEHTSELQSRPHLVCRLLLEKKKKKKKKKN